MNWLKTVGHVCSAEMALPSAPQGDVVDRENLGRIKAARIANFLAVPRRFEQLSLLGTWVCVDSFLAPLTVLPLQVAQLLWRSATQKSPRRSWSPSERSAAMRFALVAIASALMRNVDASRLYHSIRGQSALKLYVIYNALEICDKLCCAFGQDVIDALFAPPGSAPKSARGLATAPARFAVAAAYLVLHTLMLSFMLATLNVAVNSYNNALMTLLMSNQFVELKGAVFKRFERENLFQLSCSDMVERFQMVLLLGMIFARNLLELYPRAAWADTGAADAAALVAQVALPLALVLVSEILVDWVKHAFIAKFNGIDARVYLECRETLQRNLMGLGIAPAPALPPGNVGTFARASPYVAKRIGFVSLPLACLCLRVGAQLLEMLLLPLPSAAPSVADAAAAAATALIVDWAPAQALAAAAAGLPAAQRLVQGVALVAAVWLALLAAKVGMAALVYRRVARDIFGSVAAADGYVTADPVAPLRLGSPKRQATKVHNVRTSIDSPLGPHRRFSTVPAAPRADEDAASVPAALGTKRRPRSATTGASLSPARARSPTPSVVLASPTQVFSVSSSLIATPVSTATLAAAALAWPAPSPPLPPARQSLDVAFGRLEFGRSQHAPLPPPLSLSRPSITGPGSPRGGPASPGGTPASPRGPPESPRPHSSADARPQPSSDVTRLDRVERFAMFKSRIV